MILNPNLTEEQAKEREALIQEAKKKAMKEMADLMGEGSEEDDDLEDDDKLIPPKEE